MADETGYIKEDSINDKIGEVLRTLHPEWGEEGRIVTQNTRMLAGKRGKAPDVVIWHPGGLPVVIESEYHPATNVEENDARPRLGEKLDDFNSALVEKVIAMRLPTSLRTANQAKLYDLVRAEESYEFCVISEPTDDNPLGRWPEKGWIKGGVEELATFIENTALSENQIKRGMNILEKGVSDTAKNLRNDCAKYPKTLKQIAECLHQKDGEQTSRMAMAIVANALSFHIAIARSEGAEDIESLDELKVNGKLRKGKILDAWRRIRQINYWPIFSIASEILQPIRNGAAHKVLGKLADVASELDDLGATSQQDLSGQMFQRLISDRKFLATFYTRPASAALLAELAVSRIDVDWSSGAEITNLRVADFACGTGALLNSAYGAMRSRHRRHGGRDSSIHSDMMENVLVGADIMPAATHLTTSVLSSAHPTKKFANTNIITLKYGKVFNRRSNKKEIFIGALDLIDSDYADSLFPMEQVHHSGTEGDAEIPVDLPSGSFDLTIMNPPFTKSTCHEAKKKGIPIPAFAGFSTKKKEQRKMSDKLKKIRGGRCDMAGHGNAGLASNFMDVADKKIKKGGVVAFVIPAAFSFGDSWKNARNLLERRYRDILVVSIAASSEMTNSAFSADTKMAEVLLVATRKGEADNPEEIFPVTYVNLERRPDSILEAIEFARSILCTSTDENGGSLQLGEDQVFGHCIASNSGFEGLSGTPGASCIKELEVSRMAVSLANHGKLHVPYLGRKLKVPTTTLGNLGQVGLVHRDINEARKKNKAGLYRGPFKVRELKKGDVKTYPILWGHDTWKKNTRKNKKDRKTTILIEPDSYGEVYPNHADLAKKRWARASRLCYNSNFRVTSQALGACLTPRVVLGGNAWPNFKCCEDYYEIPLVLWANTTLGLISHWCTGARQHSGRTLVTVSVLPSIIVLDPRELEPDQIKAAKAKFKEFSVREMLPAREAHRDEVRKDLDRAVLIDVLGLPESILKPEGSIDLLRQMWCREPTVRDSK